MGSSPFDSLVAQLSADERNALLERIKAAAPVSLEPLYSASSAPSPPGVPPKPEDMGLMTRVILFLRGLFSGKSRDELMREDELRQIARKIELNFAGVIDRRRGLLLGVVAEELRGLRDAARFFYDALDRSVERDRPAFYAFLGSLELPATHDRLVTEARPSEIAAAMIEARGGADESAVRSMALSTFDSAFADISDKGRKSMYEDLRSILFLKRLSGFLFERLIGMFREGVASDSGIAASILEARDLLLDLGDIIFSMSEAPSIELMEAIFMFAERDELGKIDDDAAVLLGSDLKKAEAALDRIRSFNSRLPLVELLRLASANPEYLPKDLPGGEDWLAIYKAYWRDRIEAELDEWRSEHRNKQLVEEIASFVGEPGPGTFAHISREESEFAPALRHDIALTFLDAFYRGPFLRELNRPLKIVLVEGEFYRKDNRIEFTDAYDALLRLPELLSALDARLGPEGELGAAWSAALKEMGPASSRRRKMQGVSRVAEEEAERVIRREGAALGTLVSIIQGFLKGEAGGRYDSLANISYIDGKANKEFLRSLGRAKDRCEKGLSLLAELSGLDFSRED
jgi:hypothetical protein